jgi:hypothetical protein
MMTYTDSPSYPPVQSPEPPRKRHTFRKWLLIASAGFAAGIALIVVISLALGTAVDSTRQHATASSTTPAAAPADTTAPADTSPPVPAGPDMQPMGGTETLTETDTGTTIGTLAISSPRVTTYPADSYGSRPQHGYYVIVTARAGADQGYASGYEVSTSDFYALASGQHYDEGDGNAYDALSDVNSELGYTTLAAGETTSGKLVFDVPSRHGQIVYAPNYDGQPVAEWSY